MRFVDFLDKLSNGSLLNAAALSAKKFNLKKLLQRSVVRFFFRPRFLSCPGHLFWFPRLWPASVMAEKRFANTRRQTKASPETYCNFDTFVVRISLRLLLRASQSNETFPCPSAHGYDYQEGRWLTIGSGAKFLHRPSYWLAPTYKGFVRFYFS